VIRGAARFFDRQEVRQGLTLLRGTARSGGGTDDLVADVRATLSGIGWTPEPPAGRGNSRDRWESLQALVSQAETYAEGPDASLNGFVDDLDRRASEQHAPVAEGVTLATLHAAKGLEWDAVFLVGLVDGTLPIQHADGDDAKIEEERRLLYVGVTRARRRLELSWALSRTSGGARRRRRSRFLYGLIPDEHPVSRTPAGRGGTKPRCRICGSPLLGVDALKLRRCSGCPADLDLDLLERLKSWRSAAAKQQSVPTYVVFTDATLTAIAEHRPADAAALVDIPGIGARKLDRYGRDVLAVVADSAAD
jgi:DNA helicase-2/ATP-dependent DNA helicase PcrA